MTRRRDGSGYFASQAIIPEQIPAYVEAVSGNRALVCGACIAYAGETDLTLVGYPIHDPLDAAAVDEAVEECLDHPVIVRGGRLSALAAARPQARTGGGFSQNADTDFWWVLDLPRMPPAGRAGQKMRHTLRRAKAALEIRTDVDFTAAHQALVSAQILSRPLAPGIRFIWSRLPQYLAASSGALLFSAYSHKDGSLAAFAIGEYAGFSTAFYQFAFRSPDAPFGAADLLLEAVLREAEARGHTRCNLGTGVNDGIGFFKRKWQAAALLPCREWIFAPPARAWWKFWRPAKNPSTAGSK